MQGLSSTFTGELYKEWERCSQRLVFSEVVSFAEKIKELAENDNHQPLAKWADDLKLQTELFSTPTVKTLLQKYAGFYR